MIAELAARQNAFLTAALLQQQQQQQQDADSQQPQVDEASQDSKPPTKLVQNVQQSDIVDMPAALQQLQQQLGSPGSSIAWPGLEYGAGCTFCFDLAAVEQLLRSSLVTGKCLLDASTAGLQESVFQGETFLAEFTLLHEVEQKVPQQDMTAEQAADAAAALLQQLPPGSSPASLLPHLEVLLSFVRKTGGSPTSSAAVYVAAWVPDGACRQLLLGCQVLGQLQLQQLVAVYEAVEDAVAAAVSIEDSISQCYSQPLTRQQVLQAVGFAPHTGHKCSRGAGSTAKGKLPAAAFVAVLGRLMLRFLLHSDAAGSQPEQRLAADAPLSVYCCNAACCRWPWQQMGSSRAAAEQLLEDAFPEGLLLGHTATVVPLLCGFM
jgi:hypothetical protein